MINKKSLVFLVGETGCGKDTIANKLLLPKIPSYTTRRMRYDDIEGVSHIFVSDDDMDILEKRDDIIAWTKTGDIRYCATSDQLVDDISIYIINPEGVRWFKDNYKKEDLNTITIGLYVPLDIRRSRCRIRGDFDSVFEKRVTAEQDDYDKFRLNGEFDYLIRNDNSNLTAAIIRDILYQTKTLTFGNL